MIKFEITIDEETINDYINMYKEHIENKHDKKFKKLSQKKLDKLRKLIAANIKAEIEDNFLEDVYQYIDFEDIEFELTNETKVN